MILTKLGHLMGGIGLFLLGMHLMTDGLKTAAGGTLRDILERGSRTAFRGILSGALITAVVQSSSAVTVAIIGFVNAGLMTLTQAVGVIYGSNVGTTMTGWLVALVGFKFDIKAIALPLIGIGMALRIVFGGKRQGAAGMAMAGFGIFFIGIDILNAAFQGLGSRFDLEALFRGDFLGLMLFVGIGFLLTVLMQSSSAAMAVTLTAAAGGLIPLSAGAALVIGANLGTTSTAALSVIGATPNAKRVAAAHVVFNLVTGATALALLPFFLSALVALRKASGLGDEPVALLALFHTTFNILGVLLMWPLTRRMVRFLEGRLRGAEEKLGSPRYLDRNIVDTPSLAMEALLLELGRIGEISIRMCRRAVTETKPDAKAQETDGTAVNRLLDAAGDFAVQMRQNRLPQKLAGRLPNALRVSRYYSEASELAGSVSASRAQGGGIQHDGLREKIRSFESLVGRLLETADSRKPGYSTPHGRERIERVLADYAELKSELLNAGAEGLVPVRNLVDELDRLSNIRRIGEQIEKGSRYLAALSLPDSETDEAAAG